MRKSSGEGNLGEDLRGAFLTFKNGLIISGMLTSSYGEALEQVKLVLGVCRARSPLRAGGHLAPCPRTLSS